MTFSDRGIVCMMISFPEPAWQGFLGRPPFDMTPVQLGLFLNNATIVYMIVLVLSGCTMGCVGAALQFFVGTLLGAIGLLFIGPSPWFGGAIPQTQGVVLMGLMICFSGIGLVVRYTPHPPPHAPPHATPTATPTVTPIATRHTPHATRHTPHSRTPPLARAPR